MYGAQEIGKGQDSGGLVKHIKDCPKNGVESLKCHN